jgi:hypothetical protein
MTKTKLATLIMTVMFALSMGNTAFANPAVEEKSVLGGDPCEFVPERKRMDVIFDSEPMQFLKNIKTIYVHADAYAPDEKLVGEDVANIAICALNRKIENSHRSVKVPVKVWPYAQSSWTTSETSNIKMDNDLLIRIGFGKVQSKIYKSSFDDIYLMRWDIYRSDINSMDRLYGECSKAFSKDRNGKSVKELLSEAIVSCLPDVNQIKSINDEIN